MKTLSKLYESATCHSNSVGSESEKFTGDTPNYIISPGVRMGEKLVPRAQKLLFGILRPNQLSFVPQCPIWVESAGGKLKLPAVSTPG